MHGPWGKWGHHEWGGGGGGPAHPAESKISSQFTTVEAARRPWGSQKSNRTGSMRHQDLIMHRICIIVHISLLLTLMIVIVSNVLLDYLFQENKTYGSGKPFAFILWCTRSRVEHSSKHVAHIGALLIFLIYMHCSKALPSYHLTCTCVILLFFRFKINHISSCKDLWAYSCVLGVEVNSCNPQMVTSLFSYVLQLVNTPSLHTG